MASGGSAEFTPTRLPHNGGMERWRDKVALVTGASSGIGAALAKMLYQNGVRVVAAARRVERLKEIQSSLHATDDRFACVFVDMRKEESILSVFKFIDEKFGGLDICINNAGIGIAAPLMSGETDKWREMLDVNVIALCVCTRESITRMRARGDSGHIVQIGSMAGHRVPPTGGIYSASKYAVRALVEGLRQELRAVDSQIRISSVSPAVTKTEFHLGYQGSQEKVDKTYEGLRMMDPEDVASTVLYCLSAPQHVQVHDILVRPTGQRT